MFLAKILPITKCVYSLNVSNMESIKSLGYEIQPKSNDQNYEQLYQFSTDHCLLLVILRKPTMDKI